MNRFAALLVLCLALPIRLGAQDRVTREQIIQERMTREQMELAAAGEEHRQEITNLEVEMARAMKSSNGTFFRRVYSDDFVGTAPYGQVMNKSAFLDYVQTSPVKYSSFVAS